MSFITPFFLSSVQKQLQPSSVGSTNVGSSEKREEIYHDGHSEGKTALFQPKGGKTAKASIKSSSMAPIKSQLFDMLNLFNEENPSSNAKTFSLPDEPALS